MTRGGRSVLGLCGGLAAVTLAGAAGGGCTVGSGSGQANGPLWLIGCTGPSPDGDFGQPTAPVDFHLDPTFFAGDATEGTSQPPINRLVIRMQRNGSAIQYNDTLTFEIEDSYEVARCVRGRTVSGVPDWDTRGLGLGPWCDWSGAGFAADGGVGDGGAASDAGTAVDGGSGADGGATPGRARIRLSSQGYVQASLALLSSCPLNLVQVSGPAVVGHSIDGWIEFVDFGGAQPDNDDPELRGAIQRDFKVNFGDRLRATFHVVLEDDRVIDAIQTQPTGPVPAPLMGATLDGSFDFDFIRARSAQPFP